MVHIKEGGGRREEGGLEDIHIDSNILPYGAHKLSDLWDKDTQVRTREEGGGRVGRYALSPPYFRSLVSVDTTRFVDNNKRDVFLPLFDFCVFL